jgi:predicted RNase H-like HicB family nuclease
MANSDQWGPATSYRCHVLLQKEEDGRWSAIVLNLPGAGSCGDSEAEALANVREAVAGAIQSYLESGEEIPWKDSLAADIRDDARHKWILVHA